VPRVTREVRRFRQLYIGMLSPVEPQLEETLSACNGSGYKAQQGIPSKEVIDTSAFSRETAESKYVFEANINPSFNTFESLVIKTNAMMSIFSSSTRTEVKLNP
jgi:hypothetical protein